MLLRMLWPALRGTREERRSRGPTGITGDMHEMVLLLLIYKKSVMPDMPFLGFSSRFVWKSETCSWEFWNGI